MCSTAHDVTLSLNCTDTYQASIQYSLLSGWTGRQATKTKTRREERIMEEEVGEEKKKKKKDIFLLLVKGSTSRRERDMRKKKEFIKLLKHV